MHMWLVSVRSVTFLPNTFHLVAFILLSFAPPFPLPPAAAFRLTFFKFLLDANDVFDLVSASASIWFL